MHQRIALAILMALIAIPTVEAAILRDRRSDRLIPALQLRTEARFTTRRSVRKKALEPYPKPQRANKQQSIRERMMARRIARMRANVDATDDPVIPVEPLRKRKIERPSARLRRASAQRRATAKDLEHRRRVRRLKRVETKAEQPDSLEARWKLFEEANRARQNVGLPTLTYNEILERSAQGHAEDMLGRDYFSHNSPEGVHPKDRMVAAGYGDLSLETCNCRSFKVFYGENLAKGQRSASDVVSDWLRSPEHREVLLSTHAKETGIGIAGNIWVQHYGLIETEQR